MILNKYDWKSFLHNLNPFWGFNRMMIKDTKGEWIISCIKCLVFQGGKMCPGHGEIDCKICKPRKLCYYPWSQEDLERFKEEDRDMENYILHELGQRSFAKE